MKNVQLQGYNSFKTSAVAKEFYEPKSLEELVKCIQEATGKRKLIIGGGCNLFFTQDFDGVVIRPEIKGLNVVSKDAEYAFVEAMASEIWDEFVEFCVSNNLSGAEQLSYIPGTVGASPVQNIGAYGAEVKDIIESVKTVDIETGAEKVFSNEECEFEYRDSIFKNTEKYVIVSVLFRLKTKFTYEAKYKDVEVELGSIANPTLRDVREAIIRIRQRKLPDEKVLPNAGSFFKNPYISKDLLDEIVKKYPDIPHFEVGGLYKIPAAYLIEKSGYKGKKTGSVGTYEKQPLVIVNYGTSRGMDIVDFMKEIQEAVKAEFLIEIKPEVRII